MEVRTSWRFSIRRHHVVEAHVCHCEPCGFTMAVGARKIDSRTWRQDEWDGRLYCTDGRRKFVCGGSFAHKLALWRVLWGSYAHIRLQQGARQSELRRSLVLFSLKLGLSLNTIHVVVITPFRFRRRVPLWGHSPASASCADCANVACRNCPRQLWACRPLLGEGWTGVFIFSCSSAWPRTHLTTVDCDIVLFANSKQGCAWQCVRARTEWHDTLLPLKRCRAVHLPMCNIPCSFLNVLFLGVRDSCSTRQCVGWWDYVVTKVRTWFCLGLPQSCSPRAVCTESWTNQGYLRDVDSWRVQERCPHWVTSPNSCSSSKLVLRSWMLLSLASPVQWCWGSNAGGHSISHLGFRARRCSFSGTVAEPCAWESCCSLDSLRRTVSSGVHLNVRIMHFVGLCVLLSMLVWFRPLCTVLLLLLIMVLWAGIGRRP